MNCPYHALNDFLRGAWYGHREGGAPKRFLFFANPEWLRALCLESFCSSVIQNYYGDCVPKVSVLRWSRMATGTVSREFLFFRDPE